MPHKPDFFIIGAPKCGTTTLYAWLKNHSDIFMPDAKEPHFFAQHLSDRYCRVRNQGAYLDLFKDKDNGQIAGEASVLYVFSKEAIKRILDFNPKAKIILMLRHPIDMIVSYHGQLLVNLEEDVHSFEQAWRLQKKRTLGQSLPKSTTDPDLLQYGEIGCLGQHLNAIQDIVPQDQLKVILLDDMAANPKRVYQDVLAFLSREDDGRCDFFRENEASAVKFQWLEKIRRSQNGFIKAIKAGIKKLPFSSSLLQFNQSRRSDVQFDPDFLKTLYLHFERDILTLEEYFGHPLKTRYERTS